MIEQYSGPHNDHIFDPAAPTRALLGDLADAMRTLEPALFDALVSISRSPRLLIATDYDGTIAPIVDRPTHAYPLQLSVVTMRALAALRDTSSAVISGRSLRDLAAMSRLPREVSLVGSHGSETDTDLEARIEGPARSALDSIHREIAALQVEHPEIYVEAKPTGGAVHLRGLTGPARDLALEVVTKLGERPGIYLVWGKEVADLTAVDSTKGDALTQLRATQGDPAVIYIGDDTSDEAALETLGNGDLGIKVTAPGEYTAARFTVADPEAVALLLTTIFELRRAWLFGRTAVPIQRHSLLANGHSVALVDPEGSICWMPHPLPHSASIFSEILGSDIAGYFAVHPTATGTNAKPMTQRYLGQSTIVETRWAGLSLVDYLAPVDEDSSETVLVRVLHGDAEAEIRFAPRPDYGASAVSLVVEDDTVRVLGTPEPIVLHAPGVEFTIVRERGSDTAVAKVTPSNHPNGSVVLTMVCGQSEDIATLTSGNESAVRARAAGYWNNWAAGLTVPTLERSAVLRSAVTLRALCHVPTGGVLAAATSSLPEGIGGIRNWDYRYTWLRDGSMTVNTLLDLGSTAEAEAFLAWLDRILAEASGPEQLHPLYAVDGSVLTTEAVLEHLPGYAGSRPVRVGNAAEHQVQLDVFGPITELILAYARAEETLSDEHWELACQMVIAVERRWMEPDHGIWEARRAPTHNVYTKVMCWVSVDRAIQLAEQFDRQIPGAWRRLREEIADDIITRGWNERVGAFTVAYDDDDLDSAALFVGLSGLLEPTDPRFVATVDAIERELRVGPTVFRYRYDDGLPGLEGGFHICTTWLIEAFILVGRIDDARDLFTQLSDLMGPTGLFSEEYDPTTEVHLGNHPQAYSHLGFIRTARMLDAL